MAPKSWPPRRSHKTTARKSVLSKCTSNLKPFSEDSVDTTPPPATSTSTSTSTSSPGRLPPNDSGLLLTPSEGKINPKLEKSSTPQSSRTNSNAEPQGGNLIMSPEREIDGGDEVEDSNISSCKADDGGGVVGGFRAEVEGKEGRDDALAEVEKAAIGAGELRKEGESRTRKVVKKKVMIVKKIVKRKVPKRVVKGSVENEEVGRVENVGNENMESEKVDPFGIGSVDTENSKFDETVALEIENQDLKEIQGEPIGSIETSPSVEKEIEATGNIGKNVLETVEVEKVDPSGIFCKETENYMLSVGVALEAENEDLKEVKREAMGSTKTGLSVESSVKGEGSSEVLVAGQNDGKESQRIQEQLENQDVQFVEMKSGDLVEDRITGPVKERLGEGEEAVKELVENKDVGLNEGVALNGETEALEGEGEGEGEEVVKEVVENTDVGFNKAVPLSAEMEALERKRRRRTEIFLGGLDKDTKEEDIREVFDQVGEVTEVRLVMNGHTGKNKGFAFLRFASAADAKKALEKYSTVKICGKQCGAQPVEGNDTLFLGNINKEWKTGDVVKLLKDAGVEKIDKVTVMADPCNFEQNRGFAFLEFETNKDAQFALSKLKKPDGFVSQMKIRVAWAQPLIEPKEEEVLKVKSIYAEYLPPSWVEEKVIDFFKRFGEIDSVSLAKNLPSSKRKDFAFVNFTTREAAIACIEAFSHGEVDDEGSKLKVQVSLAKPNPKAKQKKQISSTTGKALENEKRKASESIIKVHEPRKKEKPASSNLEGTRVDKTDSATDELLQLLRQQALVGQTRPAAAGYSNHNYHYTQPGSMGPLSALGTHPLPSDPRRRVQGTHWLSSEPRGFLHTYLETPHISRSPSAVTRPVGLVSLPYSQQPQTSYTHESSYGFEDGSHVKTRQEATYFGHSGIYRRS